MIPTEMTEHINKWISRGNVTVVTLHATTLVLRHPQGHLNGYCWIEKSRVPKQFWDYSEIQSDLDVHGGITYSEPVGDYIMYGFDTAHYGDEENPLLRDPEEIKSMALHMREEILRAVKLWCKETKAELDRVCPHYRESA